MQLKGILVIMGALVICMILAAGCSSGKTTATAPATPAAGAQQPAAAAANPTATVTTVTTAAAPTPPPCPDANGKGVWTGTWDTRNEGVDGRDIRDALADASQWNDWPTITVKLTQKCWNVTGTFVDQTTSPPCTGGIISGTINGNQLTGTWSGCEECPNHDCNDGRFSVYMSPDNNTFIGKLVANYELENNVEDWCPDCPHGLVQCALNCPPTNWCTDCAPSWAGKRT